MSRGIYFDKSKTFNIPFILKEDDDVFLQKDIFSLFYGHTTFMQFDFILSVKRVRNRIIKGFENVENIELEVIKSSTREKKSLFFGSICLLEYIAYCIEKNLFRTPGLPTFPYKVPELLASHLYPDFQFNDITLVSISEISLDSMHPGSMFVDIIQRMKKENYKPLNRSDVVNFCAKYNFTKNGKTFSFEEVYIEYSNDAENSLKDYFTSDLFKDARLWLETIFNIVRKSKSDFSFTNFLTSNGKKELYKYFELIGSPLMSNSNEYQYLYIPFNQDSDMNVPLFKAIEEVYNILHGYRRNCTLKDHCSRLKDKNIVNQNCDISPWNKSKEEILCSFGIIWKLWGLGEKEPIL